MSEKTSNIKISLQEFRYSLRSRYVIFPIDIRDFRDLLAKNGYELSPIRGQIPGRPLRIAFSGDIARKGENIVYMDTSEGTIGISGKSEKDAIEAFENITEIILSNLGFDLNTNAWFYEIVAHYIVRTSSSPLSGISKIIESNPISPKISAIIGEKTGSFSLRLSPKNSLPNSENWYDISIEQDVLLPEAYHVGVVFRNSNRKKVKNFASSVEIKIAELVKLIEGRQ